MPTRLLGLLILSEWRHHPWRQAAVLLAVSLGVALAFSVHLINQSALAEFSAAVRAANGEPDLSLRGRGFDDAVFERAAADPDVQLASAVLEIETYARAPDGRRVAVRVLGLDTLQAVPLAPALLPRPAAGEDRLVFLDPAAAFPNPAARERLGLTDGDALALQAGPDFTSLRVAGTVAAAGPPTVVMDLAGAQQGFDALGRITRIDLRLVPGADTQALLRRLALPSGVTPAVVRDSEQRVSSVSRAYRVNLTVLALVALFVGAFLVFSVVALSVAQRTPGFALLGVLGMSATTRQRWVLLECALLGALGSLIGLLLGAGMAAAALRFMAGDLGGGFFPGITPRLRLDGASVTVFGLLGTASAVAGGWWPARQAQAIAPAQALKGLGNAAAAAPPAWPGLALLAAGALAALAPPVADLPLAAYAAVALLLVGGVALVPAVVQALLRRLPQDSGPMLLLALQRARFQRRTATAAVGGVVASLALSVALTVMVASFRTGVSQWLDSVLPADLYARSASNASAADQAWLPGDFVSEVATVPGVQRAQAMRVRALTLAPDRPPVTLIVQPLADPMLALALTHPPLPPATLAADEIGVYVSEAMVALYDARPGTALALPLGEQTLNTRVLGVWRDYARQFGAVILDDTVYRRLTGDTRVNDLAVWLQPGADPAAVQAALRARLSDPGLLDFASSADLRQLSLRIFDRSFAVTYYLQAVAIAIGLVGVAASLSAQVLARRKEFGLLSHLGLTRKQVVGIVAAEGAAWVAAGAAVGLLLGLAISAVLVFVVNPQSFHWTMDLVLPWLRLLALCAAVVAAGTLTAALSARRAAGRSAVLSVKEDW